MVRLQSLANFNKLFFTVNCVEKDENKEKEAGNGPFIKQFYTPFQSRAQLTDRPKPRQIRSLERPKIAHIHHIHIVRLLDKYLQFNYDATVVMESYKEVAL